MAALAAAPAAAAPPVAGRRRGRPVGLPPREPGQLRVHLAVVVVGEQVVEPAADQHVLPQRHRPVLVDDHVGAAAHLGQPVAELLGVAHRRRQRHHPHRLGQVDDDLFPHRAAGAVRQVVHLVEHDVAEVAQRRRAGVEHVAQHLGGHDHDRRVAVDAVVAGQQAHGVGVVPAHQVAVLLVGQRLDGRGVKALPALLQRQVDGVLAHHGLARPGGRRDEHPVPAVSAPQAATWNWSNSKS